MNCWTGSFPILSNQHSIIFNMRKRSSQFCLYQGMQLCSSTYNILILFWLIIRHIHFALRGKPEDHNDSDEDSNGSGGEDEYDEYDDDEDGPPFKGWKPVSDARLRRWCRRAYRWSNWCCNTYRINCHFVQYSWFWWWCWYLAFFSFMN